MARYTGPVCRLCRREGMKLYLKGEKCYSAKCVFEHRPEAPGHRARFRRKPTEYGIQLREKQKARRIYGVLERQFRTYYRRATRARGVSGEVLLQLLERRLDNVVYRMGLASSRAEARQLVRHGHFMVNGRRVNIPSFQVREGDEVAVHEKSRNLPRLKELAGLGAQRGVPDWLEVDHEKMKGKVLRLPKREEIDVPVQERLIIEFYSR
ncbi:MAG TPA: 30S ribosomal protein S4 [Clostridiales bacterium]|nr:30S ribosomal protein S4 [Clostridiales bacterium]